MPAAATRMPEGMRLPERETRMGTLLLLDGNSLINRAYYGVKSSTTLSTADGTPTNAVFGFVNILNRHLEDIRPDRVCVAFDRKAPTFRHAMYDNYKGDRKGMPDDLAVQMPLLKDMLDAMRIPRVEYDGLEADDFIGILSRMGEDAGEDVVIVTGDRDALQLVDARITVMIPSTGKGGTETNVYTPDAVLEKYGVPAASLIEVKGLMGDPSDSIPGVPSVGEKTALDLVSRYGTIEGVYEHLAEITKPALNRNLADNRELAFLSRTLGVIVREAGDRLPEGFLSLEALQWDGPDRTALRKAFERLEFRSLIKKFKLDGAPSPDGQAAASGGFGGRSGVVGGADAAGTDIAGDGGGRESGGDADKAAAGARSDETGEDASAWGEPVPVGTPEALARVMEALACRACDCALLLVDPTGTPTAAAWEAEVAADEAPLFQMAMALPEEKPRRLLLGLSAGTDRWIMQTGGMLPERDAVSALARLLSDCTVHCHDMKAVFRLFDDNGVPAPAGLFDTMLAEYLLDPSRDRYLLRDLAVRHLGVEGDTPDLLLAEAGRQAVPLARLMDAAAHAVRVLPAIGRAQRGKLEANGQTALYADVEAPLAIVLGEMERDGFRVDPAMLAEYGRTLQTRIGELEAAIHEMAGEPFNILSTKQLGIILFEKLGLPTAKKTKTGYSTDADVLEALADAHPIVPALLEYRQLTKLKSTYADGLLKVISPVTGRVHSRFNQTIAVTGRISSTEPNLQNIPVRTPLGRLIRKAFVPRDGCVFVDADYSQIELRVLAHVTGDETLRQAFRDNTDIHALTASQVFHVPLAEVTGEMRRRAKAVNFGIIYGISDFGLSRDLGIYRREAADYIEGYLDTYPGVRRYMEEIVEQARRDGYVETLLHRRRYLPELASANFNVRSFGKRVALNTPIQGTAADIIKIAMIRVRDALRESFPEARLILQVHDELVVETPAGQAEAVAALVRACMEQAMALSVPMVADTGIGPNWYDAKQ